MKLTLLQVVAAMIALLAPTVFIRAQDAQFATLTNPNSPADPNSPVYSRQARDQVYPSTFRGGNSSSDTDGSSDVALSACGSRPHFEVSASLLYLQPGAGNLEYGTLVSPLPVPSPNWENESISPKYTPAFNFGLSYFVPESGNDIRSTWTHLDSTDSASFVGSPDQMAGPPYLIGPGANAYNIGNGSVHFGYDAVNLEAGHLWDTGGLFHVRVFGGVQYASIAQDLTGTFSNNAGTETTSNTTYSRFFGAGPRLGVNSQFNYCRFQFLGEIAAAVLVGNQQSHIDFSTTSTTPVPGLAYPNTQSFTSPNATQVIPSIDCRLGASYTFPLNFKIEAGYQAVVYVNAVNTYSLTEVTTPPVAQSVGVFFATGQHLQSNFTAQGPYLSASWAF